MSKPVVFSEENPRVVIEVGQAFEGSITLAHSFVAQVAACGADGIKFQLHIAEEESSLQDSFRIVPDREFESRFEYWKRHELSSSAINELVAHAHSLGLLIGFSTFSLPGLDRLSRHDIDFLKIGSGEAIQPWFVREAAGFGPKVVVSTGLSRISEIQSAVDVLREGGSDPVLLQCVTKYPSSMEDVGLNVMQMMRSRFDCLVGLSDHSGRLAPSVFALGMGASFLEVHGTFSRSMAGPDSESSLEFSEIQSLLALKQDWLAMKEHPASKDAVAAQLEPSRLLFGRSLAYRRGFSPGYVLQHDDLYFAKPGIGIPPMHLEEVIGTSIVRPVDARSLVRPEDLDGPRVTNA